VTAKQTAELDKLRKSTYVKWVEELKKQFLVWWSKTQWAKEGKGHPNWDSELRSSSFWKEFHQCANIVTGEPKLCCKTCEGLLIHPSIHNSGSTRPTKHLARIKSGTAHWEKRASQPMLSEVIAKV
jgi:hypothetical protein